MGNLGFMEILLILFVILILFGPSRLVEIGGFLGKAIREFQKALEGQSDTKDSGDKKT